MLALRVPLDIEERLSALAKTTGRTDSIIPAKRSLNTWAIWRFSFSQNSGWPASMPESPGRFP